MILISFDLKQLSRSCHNLFPDECAVLDRCILLAKFDKEFHLKIGKQTVHGDRWVPILVDASLKNLRLKNPFLVHSTVETHRRHEQLTFLEGDILQIRSMALNNHDGKTACTNQTIRFFIEDIHLPKMGAFSSMYHLPDGFDAA